MKSLTLVTVLTLLAAPAIAQERTAGQTNDAQVNWTALSTKLDAIDNQNKAIAASVTALQATVSGISGKLDAIAACGVQQKVWNGASCVTTLAPKVESASFSTPFSGWGQGAPKMPTSATCVANGYDALTSKVANTSIHSVGGNNSSQDTYTSSYSYTLCAGCEPLINKGLPL